MLGEQRLPFSGGVPPAPQSSAPDKAQVSVARWSKARRQSTATVATGIELHPGTAVQLHGLKAAPNLNGALGICMWFSVEQSRWIIRLANGEKKAVKLDNLILGWKTSEAQLKSQQQPSTQAQTPPLAQLPSEELREAMRRFPAIAKKLGGIKMNAKQYMENFGLITARAPWGERLWEGIAAMAQKQASVYSLTKNLMNSQMQLCHWTVPAPFCRLGAQLPIDTDQWQVRSLAQAGLINDTYPGACWLGWIDDGVTYYEVRCLAQLINCYRSWFVHETRLWVATPPQFWHPSFAPSFIPADATPLTSVGSWSTGASVLAGDVSDDGMSEGSCSTACSASWSIGS